MEIGMRKFWFAIFESCVYKVSQSCLLKEFFKNSTAICSYDKILTKDGEECIVLEICSQKQLASPSITSQEQLKYLYLGELGFHDGKLCQMIQLYVAHSNY
jgi:hypothetical protein